MPALFVYIDYLILLTLIKIELMENLIIYPENQKQLQILKSLLEEMKIKFKSEIISEFEEMIDGKSKIRRYSCINKW